MRQDSTTSRAPQAGYAVLLLLVLLTLGGAALLVSSLESAQQSVARDKVTEQALARAKAALIGYAARDENRPGSLPCPDPKPVPDGTPMDPPGIPYNCTSASGTRIGRLPWRTLGLPELRDGSGELLWYVVSNNVRATNTTGLNSDTAADVDGNSESDTHGDIELRSATDASIASNVVALVIAPGRVQSGQTRPSAAPDQYLELLTTNPPAVDVGTSPFVKNVYRYRRLDPSNDVVLPISHANLFTVVDQAVFSRMRKTLVPKMQALAAKWTRYPFAMPFDPLGIGAKGVPATNEGSLPWAYAGTGATRWQSGPAVSLASGPGTLDAAVCTVQADPKWLKCDITHTDAISFNIDAVALEAGLSFTDVGWKADYATALTTLVSSNWLATGPDASGNANVRFTATTPAAPGSGVLTVWLKIDLAYWADNAHPWSSQPSPCNPPADDLSYAWPRTCDAIWFVKNGWHRQVYYAISPEVAFGGSGTCTPGVNCLEVGAVPTPTNNARALLLLAGRPLNGSTRPSPVLDDYVEGANLTTGDRMFETGPPRKPPPAPRNDNIAILSP